MGSKGGCVERRESVEEYIKVNDSFKCHELWNDADVLAIFSALSRKIEGLSLVLLTPLPLYRSWLPEKEKKDRISPIMELFAIWCT
jgi:hypothetical protein